MSSASVRLTSTERMGRATLVGKSGVPSWTHKWRCLLAIYEERTRRHLATGVWGSGLCQRVQGAALANSSTLLSVSFSLSSWGPWGTELKKQWLHSQIHFLNIKWVQLPNNGASVLFSSPIPAYCKHCPTPIEAMTRLCQLFSSFSVECFFLSMLHSLIKLARKMRLCFCGFVHSRGIREPSWECGVPLVRSGTRLGQAQGSVGHWPLQRKYLYCFGHFTCHFLLNLCKISDTGWQPSVSWGRRKPSSEGGHFHVAPCSLSFTVSQEPCGSRSVRSVREAVLPLREPQSVVEMTVLRTVCAQRTAVHTSVDQT